MSDFDESIGIIGAGPAGLITAHTLVQDGFKHVQVLTRDQNPGGVWAKERVYSELVINNVHGEFRFSSLPMPTPVESEKTGGRLTGPDMCNYLESFTDTYLKGLIRYKTHVLQIKRDTPKGWLVEVENTETGNKETLKYAKIVLCTGARGCSTPSVPESLSPSAAQAAGFNGPVFHSSQLKSQLDNLQKHVESSGNPDDYSVVVAGGGRSSQDMATYLTKLGLKVTVVFDRCDAALGVKSPLPDFIRKSRFLGLLSPHIDLRTRFERFLHQTWLGSKFTHFIWNTITSISMDALRIPKDSPLRNQHSFFWGIRTNDEGVMRPDGFFGLVSQGKISLKAPAHIAKFGGDGRSVILDNGEVLKADALVLATGYTSSWKTLFDEETASSIGITRTAPSPESMKYKWNYTTLSNPPPAHPESEQWALSIYRGLVPCKSITRRDFAVNGSLYTTNNGYVFEVASHWISSYFQNDKIINLPETVEEALEHTERNSAWLRKRYPDMLLWVNDSYSSNIAVWTWPQLVDELLEDMGLKSLRSGGNWFNWPFKVVDLQEIANLKAERDAMRKNSGTIPEANSKFSKEEKKWILQRCANMRALPTGFDPSKRTQSDRFDLGTNSTLLRNAKIWTGSLNGTEIIYGDVLLHNGIVKALGYIPKGLLSSIEVNVHDLQGAWVTPGLVDLHSHIGVESAPSLGGSNDGNSRHGPILPWLRSIDGLNTHDDAYKLSIAGGVTTAQVLPGSANNIGGQAFVIKLRSTLEKSTISKLVEPPHTLNGTEYAYAYSPRWRHMKHACGENPSRVYGATRMDSAWAFRQAYNEARKIKQSQDKYCEIAEKGDWKKLDNEWPESLQWEALVDVLRGKVKLSVHCYEPVDFDAFIRITNEFKFPVASFHHAGSAYLVPDLLKKTYGGAPAIALFSSNFRKKREAYRGSEFGPRTLADNGIRVVMKSDHPVVNSRYLLNEAAVAFYYGLPANLALSSVTTVPAEAAGLGHRVGRIHPGYDADVVIWDSHPLSLGATPIQVYIDGIPQLENPVISSKPPSFQDVPQTPNFDAEAIETVKYEGLPPLVPTKSGERESDNVLFVNVSGLWTVQGQDLAIISQIEPTGLNATYSILVRQGKIVCTSEGDTECTSHVQGDYHIIDLEGGMITPALTTFGTEVGISEIRLEQSTNDGVIVDPLTSPTPAILGEVPIIKAIDGVTTAIVPPTGTTFWKGLSTAFNTGSTSSLQPGAIVKDVVALHVEIGRAHRVSVSTEIATLRRLLLEEDKQTAFTSVSEGAIPLVIHVDNADIMATVIRLKQEVEDKIGTSLKFVFAGAAEAWMIASDIASANINVILSPSRFYPETWDKRRILPGPPLSYETPLTVLLNHNITVAIGVENGYEARNTRFDMAWAALESSNRVDRINAYAIASTNLEKILGFTISQESREYVAWKGGDIFDMSSKAVAVFSSTRGSYII